MGQPWWTGAVATLIWNLLIHITSCRPSSPQTATLWTSSSTRTVQEHPLDGVSTGRRWHQVGDLFAKFYQHGLQQCQDWSNILNSCKIAKFYDFLHGLFGLSTKGLRNQFYYKSQMALKEDSRILTDADQYQSMRKILFRAKSSLDWNNQQKTGNFSKCFSPTKS